MNTVVKPGQLWKYKGAFQDLVSPYRNVRIQGYSQVKDDSYVVESATYSEMVFTISHEDFMGMWELDTTTLALEQFDSDLEDLLK